MNSEMAGVKLAGQCLYAVAGGAVRPVARAKRQDNGVEVRGVGTRPQRLLPAFEVCWCCS
jgi:hypothetical protein